MRWVWITIGMLGFALAWAAKTPGWLGIGLILGFIGITMTVFAIAAMRIEERARPEAMMISADELGQLRKRPEGQRVLRPVPPPANAAPRAIPQRPQVPQVPGGNE
jgi:hypothetical protein